MNVVRGGRGAIYKVGQEQKTWMNECVQENQ